MKIEEYGGGSKRNTYVPPKPPVKETTSKGTAARRGRGGGGKGTAEVPAGWEAAATPAQPGLSTADAQAYAARRAAATVQPRKAPAGWNLGDALKSLFARREPAYGGSYNPTVVNKTQSPLYNALLPREPAYGGSYNPTVSDKTQSPLFNALVKAFGVRPPAYGGTYNPTATNPAFGGTRAKRTATTPEGRAGYTGTGPRIYVAGATQAKSAASVLKENPWLLYPTLPETPAAAGSSGGYGGYSGWGGGGGGGGYGGGGSDYEAWLKELLTKWSFG
jgi:uncharacterized membrane protein YgcG